jgi:hypothetical protein
MAEKIVTLFWSVPAEGVTDTELLDGPVHGVTRGDRQRFGDITDSATDEAAGGVRVRLGEGFDATIDFREQVSRFEFKVVGVEVRHGSNSRTPVDRERRRFVQSRIGTKL